LAVSTGFWTQDLAHARLVLHQLSHTTSSFPFWICMEMPLVFHHETQCCLLVKDMLFIQTKECCPWGQNFKDFLKNQNWMLKSKLFFNIPWTCPIRLKTFVASAQFTFSTIHKEFVMNSNVPVQQEGPLPALFPFHLSFSNNSKSSFLILCLFNYFWVSVTNIFPCRLQYIKFD
jgi:hypothetical protein